MKLTEKAAYIQGLIDGLGIDASTKEGKVICAISELLADLTDATETLDDEVNDLYEDMGNLVDAVFEDEDEDEEEEDEEQDAYELTCPKCGAVNVVTEDEMMSMDVKCANCGVPFEFEIMDEDEAEDEE